MNSSRVQLGVTASRKLSGDLTQAATDMELFAELGVRSLFVEFEWAWLEPHPGRLNGEAVEWFQRLLGHAAEVGVSVWGQLHAGSEPRWFTDDGGFSDQQASAKWWPRWVERMADRFGDQVAGFVPISNPVGWASRWAGDPKRHSDAMLNMAVAWRDSWRILHGSTLVATDLHLAMGRSVENTMPAIEAARLEELLRWKLWLRSLRDGVFVLPGRFERQIADLAGSLDILGVTTTTDIRGVLSDDELARWQERLGTIVRRLGEEGPERPIALGLRLGWNHPAERMLIHQAARCAVDDILGDRIPLQTVIIDPGIDLTDDGRTGGLVGRDRMALTTTGVWTDLTP